jgi:hypothetical protein
MNKLSFMNDTGDVCHYGLERKSIRQNANDDRQKCKTKQKSGVIVSLHPVLRLLLRVEQRLL